MLAKQSLRNHRSSLTTGEPRLQDGGNISIRPIDGERLAVYQHQYHRLSRRMQCLKQLLLASRQVERSTRTAFPRTILVLTQHGNDYVAFTGFRHRLGDASLFPLIHGYGQYLRGRPASVHNITTFGIIHFGNVFQISAQTGQHGNRFQSVRAVTAGHEIILISQRTCHQHFLYPLFIQRKNIILIFQKHESLLLHLLHKIHIPVCPAYVIGGFRIGHIRPVEQSQTEFHPQHFRHTLVYRSH